MRELDEKKTQIATKMTRVSQMHEQAFQKAKNLNQKHQEKIESFNTQKAEEAGSLRSKIEDKMTSAASRREQHIEQVKTTAAQSATLKPTASTQ